MPMRCRSSTNLKYLKIKCVTGSYNLRTSLITNVAKMQEERISLEGLAAFGKMCSDRV